MQKGSKKNGFSVVGSARETVENAPGSSMRQSRHAFFCFTFARKSCNILKMFIKILCRIYKRHKTHIDWTMTIATRHVTIAYQFPTRCTLWPWGQSVCHAKRIATYGIMLKPSCHAASEQPPWSWRRKRWRVISHVEKAAGCENRHVKS